MASTSLACSIILHCKRPSFSNHHSSKMQVIGVSLPIVSVNLSKRKNFQVKSSFFKNYSVYSSLNSIDLKHVSIFQKGVNNLENAGNPDLSQSIVRRSQRQLSPVVVKRCTTFFGSRIVLFPKIHSPSNGSLQNARKRLLVVPNAKILGNIGATAAGQADAISEAAKSGDSGLASLIISVLFPLALGLLVSMKNNPNTQWYRELKKPSWSPPDWLFGSTWSVLYPLMGFSAWLVFKSGGIEQQAVPLRIYMAQLILNLSWPISFFGMKNIFLALVNTCFLLIMACITAQSFRPVSETAFKMFIPYILWIAYATALNYNLWRNNRDVDKGKGYEQRGSYSSL